MSRSTDPACITILNAADLRAAREKLGWSRDRMAHELSGRWVPVTGVSVGNYESGRRGIPCWYDAAVRALLANLSDAHPVDKLSLASLRALALSQWGSMRTEKARRFQHAGPVRSNSGGYPTSCSGYPDGAANGKQ